MKQRAGLEQTIDFVFRDRALLEQALTHRSAGRHNNERLEFVGDAVLGMVVADCLYQRFPEASEGQMSRLRAALVKRETLAAIARELALGDHLILGEGEQRSGGHARDSILADALEAVIGAAYRDQGCDAARNLVLRLWAPRIAGLTLEREQKDPKTRLQEWLQARGHALPVYEVTHIEGKQHRQTFHVRCHIGALELSAAASGGSRRKAEQASAQAMLDQLHE